MKSRNKQDGGNKINGEVLINNQTKECLKYPLRWKNTFKQQSG